MTDERVRIIAGDTADVAEAVAERHLQAAARRRIERREALLRQLMNVPPPDPKPKEDAQ